MIEGENVIVVECANGVYTAVLPSFVNYEVSVAGFGDDANEAVLDLIMQLMKDDEIEH
jgi:hypothetical protein